MKITLEFDELSLTYTDAYLAALWNVAQFNPAPAEDREACQVVELIGREIIRRWLEKTPPELWHRQGTHAQKLPTIQNDADVRNALIAACEVIDCDHGSNVSEDRAKARRAVDDLEKALAKIRLTF